MIGVGSSMYDATRNASGEPVDHEQRAIDLAIELEDAKRQIAGLKEDLRQARVEATASDRRVIDSRGANWMALHEENEQLRAALDDVRATNADLRQQLHQAWSKDMARESLDELGQATRHALSRAASYLRTRWGR